MTRMNVGPGKLSFRIRSVRIPAARIVHTGLLLAVACAAQLGAQPRDVSRKTEVGTSILIFTKDSQSRSFGIRSNYLAPRDSNDITHFWNTLSASHLQPEQDTPNSVSTLLSPTAAASPYVALDSPAYAQLQRLASLGYIHSQFLGLRPWTRITFARMLMEADENGAVVSAGEAAELHAELRREFAFELEVLDGATQRRSRAEVERVYTRVLGIAGTPLNDSFHLGQTVYNDFGRPYGEGFNNSSGFEATASSGRFLMAVRAEYQRGAGAPTYPDSVRQLLASLDRVPQVFLPSSDVTSRLELLDTYAGVNLKEWQLTFGKQTLWQGVTSSTALMFSNNSAPVPMLRLNRISPLALPGFLKWLGPLRSEFFLGIAQGHHYPTRPAVQGLKLSLKPTPNLEFGFSRTVMFAGAGRGLTFRSFWDAFSSVDDSNANIPGSPSDVGDRRGQFEFHYRLPYLRNWVAIYGDFMTDDDPSPLSAPHRSILAPGIEFTRLPGLERLQLKAEAVMSNQSSIAHYHGLYFYWNGAYPDGYTNRGNIMGSWIGRNSRAYWSEARYWFSPTKTLAATFRNVQLDRDFVAGGGHTTDLALSGTFRVRNQWGVNATAQFERWKIPVLDPRSRRNVSTFLEVSYYPGRR